MPRRSEPYIRADAYLAAIVDSDDDAIISNDFNGLVTCWNPRGVRVGRVRESSRVDHFETIRQHKRLIDGKRQAVASEKAARR